MLKKASTLLPLWALFTQQTIRRFSQNSFSTNGFPQRCSSEVLHKAAQGITLLLAATSSSK